MNFSSIPFLFFFLPLVFALYYLVPRKAKNVCLVVFSLVFYAWGGLSHTLLLVLTIFVDYVCGLLIGKSRQAGRRGAARAVLVCGIVINLGLLVWFKYAGMLADTFAGLTGTSVSLPEIALPIGISFYTFESISYAVDVYKQQTEPERNLLRFATYLSFFPHVTSGPITRYRDIRAEIANRRETLEGFTSGFARFGKGLFKKILLADTLALLVSRVQYTGNPSTLAAWMGVLAFTFQLYFDFSGYSDMAIGLGRMFGLTLPENFDHPYASRSASEFWRRWHMTLGGWFRDYVYIPRQPARHAAHRAQSGCGVGAHGHLARGKLEFRAVGRVLRRADHL